jgi:hypothetical protein
MYIQLQGQHPVTGEIVNSWSCAIKEVPTFLMYLGRTTTNLDGETSQMRSEMQKTTQSMARAAAYMEQIFDVVQKRTGNGAMLGPERNRALELEHDDHN